MNMEIFKNLTDGCKAIAKLYYSQMSSKKMPLVKDIIDSDKSIDSFQLNFNKQIVDLKIYGVPFIFYVPFNVFETEEYEKYVTDFINERKILSEELSKYVGKILKIDSRNYGSYIDYVLCNEYQYIGGDRKEIYIKGSKLRVNLSMNKIIGFNTINPCFAFTTISEIEIVDDLEFMEVKKICKDLVNQTFDNIFNSNMYFGEEYIS